jgi:hypothetical protein
MANPLKAFQGLKSWQKLAVAGGGGAVVVGYVLYARRQKAAAAMTPAAVPAAAAAATATDLVTDPTTGQAYPADSVDPATGLTYGTEIQEYGSVAAADEQGTESGDAAIEEGLTQTQYDQETGQAVNGSGGPAATNAAWISEVETSLSQLGYSSSDIQQGLAKYFSSSPQGTSADGTNLYQMMDTAIGEYGPPPTGTYALVKGGTTAATGQVTVPDEVGRTDLATAEASIRAAGLVPLAAGDPAKGNKGKVTAQDPAAGSKVTKGTSVTLTYKTGTAPAAGDAAVPDVTGKQLDEALSDLKAAGLTNTTAKPVKGITQTVTAQAPAAGTKVAKGSHVDLTTKKTR